MIVRALALAALLLPVPFALADGDFSRTLTVSDAPDLYVSTGSGNIRIHSGSSGHIEIRGHVHPNNGWSLTGGGDVNERVRRILANPPVTQSGNTVRVGEEGDRSLLNNISIEYEITVPASVALNLRTGSGDLEINDAGRFLAANTGSGSIRARGNHGAAELHTGSGDIELEQAAAGNVSVKTGSGSIRIRGLDGALNATTGSGDLEAQGHLSGPARLSTGSGSARLRLSPDSHFDLSAATGSGSVRVNFPNAPQATDSSRHHFAGPVNGGGPSLDVHTGSGDIEISTT